jgi:hypothetical protein
MLIFSDWVTTEPKALKIKILSALQHPLPKANRLGFVTIYWFLFTTQAGFRVKITLQLQLQSIVQKQTSDNWMPHSWHVQRFVYHQPLNQQQPDI